MKEYTLSDPYCRLLLTRQGETGAEQFTSEQLIPTAKEAGFRISAAVGDVAYQEQYARTQNDPSIVLMARFEEGECRWMDPRLLGVLSNDFGLDKIQDGQLIGRLLYEYYEFCAQHPSFGDYGLAISRANGVFEVDMKPAQEYKDLWAQVLQAQEDQNATLEDELYDKMDVVWAKLTPHEREVGDFCNANLTKERQDQNGKISKTLSSTKDRFI